MLHRYLTVGARRGQEDGEPWESLYTGLSVRALGRTIARRWPPAANWLRARMVDCELLVRARDSKVLHYLLGLGEATGRVVHGRGGVVVCDTRSPHHAWSATRTADLLRRDGVTWQNPAAWNLRRFDRELARADLVVCPSEWAAATYRKCGVQSPVVGVTLGCDLDRFRPVGEPPRRLTLLFAGRRRPVKGFATLARALKLLERPVDLLVTGTPDRWTSRWVSGVPGEVRFLGEVPHRRMAEVYAASSVLVLPSYEEPFGLVVLEALASGRPVVVSDNVGAAEVLVGTEAGWVCPAGDAAALATVLEKLAVDPDALRGATASAREVAERWSWDAYGSRLLDVYEEYVLPLL